MATGSNPQVYFKSPTFRSSEDDDIEASAALGAAQHADREEPSRQPATLRQRNAKHPHIAEPRSRRSAVGHNVYLGSYANSSRRLSADASRATPIPSPRASTSQAQLEHLLQAVDADLETYGVEELRDGFFDATFYRPIKRHHGDLTQKTSLTLPDPFKHENQPLSVRCFLPQQLREIRSFFGQVLTTRAGVKLLKSFLGFFITYIMCLIPTLRDWLGRYNYIMVISAIVNHPGRAIGSQIDGAVLTTTGTAAGLGWGSLALYVSTSTPTAQSGYGGVLATFLVIFAIVVGWLRCFFIRFYQAIIASGFAICYACLANTSQEVGWKRVFDYGIPWVFGQAVCLLISIVIFPDAGSRSLA